MPTQEEILAKANDPMKTTSSDNIEKAVANTRNELGLSLSLRDHFAIATLTGLISRLGSKESSAKLNANAEFYARTAYHYADKMLEERNK